MKRSIAVLAAAALAVGFGAGVAADAHAEARCTVVAKQLDGAALDETRTEAADRARHLACGAAVGVCDAKLTVIRLEDGVFPGDYPGAYCQVESASVIAFEHACDVSACASAYRSFRASDCTFQPYGGSRRLCTK